MSEHRYSYWMDLYFIPESFHDGCAKRGTFPIKILNKNSLSLVHCALNRSFTVITCSVVLLHPPEVIFSYGFSVVLTCFCPWTLNLYIAIVLLRLRVHYSVEIKRYKSQIRIRIVHAVRISCLLLFYATTICQEVVLVNFGLL